MAVDRGGEAEEALRSHPRHERLAAAAQIGAGIGAAEHRLAVDPALEPLGEFLAGAVAQHGEPARDRQRLVGIAARQAERDDPALELADGGGGRVRARVGGDHHQPLDPFGEMLAERERDHAAIRGADRGMGLVHAEPVERGAQGDGLVERARRDLAGRIGDEIQAENAITARIGRAAGPAKPGHQPQGKQSAEMPPSRTIKGAPSGPASARPHRRAEAGELRRQRHLER